MTPSIPLYRHPDGFKILVAPGDVDFFTSLSFFDSPPLPLVPEEASPLVTKNTTTSDTPVAAQDVSHVETVVVQEVTPSTFTKDFVIADWATQINGFVTMDIRHDLHDNKTLQVAIVNKGNERMETPWVYVSRDMIRLTVPKTPESRYEGTITVSTGA